MGRSNPGSYSSILSFSLQIFHDVEIIECKISSQTLNSGFLGGELLAVLTVELTS